MPDRLRWGILGTARINRRLLPAFRASARSDVRAVASRDLAKARAVAADWAVPEAVAGYATLLADDRIDAVYIPLPNSMHVEWTLAAVAAGKHVLCEKPLALDPADVDRIRDAASRAGVVVEEGFMYRHEPLTARVRALVIEGALGELRHITAGFTYTMARDGNVRLDPALGGGALWDVGCYPATYACLLAGTPARAMGTATLGPTGVDEAFTGLVAFDGGATAVVHANFHSPYRTWLDVTGTDGTLTVPNPFRPGPVETLVLAGRDGERRIEVPGSPLIFAREIADFEAAVLDGAPPVVGLDESRRTAALLAGLAASAQSDGPMYPQER